MKVRKAVIPAAGLGTRMLPATKTVPKEMLPLVDKPVIQYVVEEAAASGIEDILVVTNRAKSAMDDTRLSPRAGGAPSAFGKEQGQPNPPLRGCILCPAEGDEGPGPCRLAGKKLSWGMSPLPSCLETI